MYKIGYWKVRVKERLVERKKKLKVLVRSKDFVLVEKIECTQNGTINFACTSVETPKVPKISNKTRINIKVNKRFAICL